MGTMENKESHLRFDLASQRDNTPSEDDDNIRKEMQLKENQTLVSKIYKLHWREDVTATSTDVIVPVDIPDTFISDRNSKYCLYFLLRYDDVWRKEKANNPTDGRVHGHLNQVDAFAVILEYNDTNSRVENMTIGPEGGKFISKKDGRITVDFPQGALDETVDFQFKAAVVDKERYDEYQKLSPDFRCVQGFTHTLGISPEVALNRPAQVCLPLDMDTKGDNSEVLFLHWKKDEEGRKVPRVIDKNPTCEPDNCYSTSVGVSTSSSYAPVCVPKKTSNETIVTSVEYLCGRKSLCNILTFISYDRKYKMHRLLVDCVDFYKVDSVISLHTQDGMEEVEKSRSRDIEMKKKTRIKISLEGNLAFFDKSIRVNSLLYDCYARTNKVMIPVTSIGGNSISIVRYSWERDNHQVFFFLDLKKEKRIVKSKNSSTNRGQTNSDRSSDAQVKSSDISKSNSSKENGRVEDLQTKKSNETDGSITRTAKSRNHDVRNGGKVNESQVRKSRFARGSVLTRDSGISKSGRLTSGTSVTAETSVTSRTSVTSEAGDMHTKENNKPNKDMDRSDLTDSLNCSNGMLELAVLPLLTDKSLSALSDSLPQSVWRSIGLELNFTNDHIITIFEGAERMKSDPRFELLREWRIRGSERNSETLIQELLDALVEIGRNDIAEILKVVKLEDREIRRNDFDRSPPAKKLDSTRSQKRSGEFIYPDGI